MKFKKITSWLLASILMMASAFTCMPLAEDTSQTTSQTGTQSATLSYDQDSSFTVTIPKTIALGSAKSATYSVNVKGDINGNDVITVIPDNSIVMKDSKGKSDVSATISQEKNKFTQPEIINNGNTTTGNVAAPDLTAGDWTGTLNFAINLKQQEQSTGQGLTLYDADGKLLAVAEESGFSTTLNGYDKEKFPTATKAVISNGVLSIGHSAFYNNTNLTSIVLPDSLTSIGDYAFNGCSGLTSIILSDNLTSIGDSAFMDCYELTSITLPDKISSIGYGAFMNCTNLREVTYQGYTYTSSYDLILNLISNGVSVVRIENQDTTFANTKFYVY